MRVLGVCAHVCVRMLCVRMRVLGECACVCVGMLCVRVCWAYRFDHFFINSRGQFSQQLQWVHASGAGITGARNESGHHWQTAHTPGGSGGADRWGEERVRGMQRKAGRE